MNKNPDFGVRRRELRDLLCDVSLCDRVHRERGRAEVARFGSVGPWQTALAIDLGLLALFAVQHSVMARPGFKRLLTRVIPASVERSTYVLASSAALIFLFWQWRPLGGTIWHVEHPVARALLLAGFAFGWTLVLVATFAINHFDLFGLRQTWRAFRGQPQSELRFATPSSIGSSGILYM